LRQKLKISILTGVHKSLLQSRGWDVRPFCRQEGVVRCNWQDVQTFCSKNFTIYWNLLCVCTDKVVDKRWGGQFLQFCVDVFYGQHLKLNTVKI